MGDSSDQDEITAAVKAIYERSGAQWPPALEDEPEEHRLRLVVERLSDELDLERKSKRRWVRALAAAIVVLLLYFNAREPRSYEDCVLRYVPKAATAEAAQALRYACEKYPEHDSGR